MPTPSATQPGLLIPVDGQVLHLSELDLYNTAGFRLSWDADNFARVSRIHPPDPAGPMMRCCRFSTCQAAAYCAAARPHAPDASLDTSSMCYDARPTPGVTSFGVLVPTS